MNLKREPVKYIRDLIKREYIKDTKCYICGSTESLELHHLYSLSQLFNNWLEEHKIRSIETVEEIKKLRIKFQQDNKENLANKNLLTLCSTHHSRLHTIYGQRYDNFMVPKIKKWVNLQREKFHGN